MTSIQTGRLLLRVPEASDAEAFFEIAQDPEVMKYATTTRPTADLDVAQRTVARLLRQWESSGFGQWTVIEQATQQVIGIVGLQTAEGWPGVEMAWLIRRSRWNNGFATEAASAALQWSWEMTALDHIISLVPPENVASMHIAKNIGEVFERVDVNPRAGDVVHIYGVHRPDGLRRDDRTN